MASVGAIVMIQGLDEAGVVQPMPLADGDSERHNELKGRTASQIRFFVEMQCCQMLV